MSAGRPHNYSFCVSRRVRAARAGPVTATTAHGEGTNGNVEKKLDWKMEIMKFQACMTLRYARNLTLGM